MSEYIYASFGEPLANSDGEVFLARKEIVRCMDCACADWFGAVGIGTFRCKVHGLVTDKTDGFCAWGERREE